MERKGRCKFGYPHCSLGDGYHYHNLYESKEAQEIRETSSTGGMKGQKPEQMSLLPWESLDVVSRVYAYGAEKYARDNWRRGYPFHLSFDACLRHLSLFWQGVDLDEESGLPHLAHAIFHLNALLVYCGDQERYGLLDDRQTARWPKKD